MQFFFLYVFFIVLQKEPIFSPKELTLIPTICDIPPLPKPKLGIHLPLNVVSN